ncbi:MAG: DUF294 nucleotidyltransferase-like domain-containing protein, partial [Candidatus Omnitrophica bacterium]|nr:DUF294 nucleotidyltransferase-like domain-containing protein [Candidatus Omnitrophota bacterium]
VGLNISCKGSLNNKEIDDTEILKFFTEGRIEAIRLASRFFRLKPEFIACIVLEEYLSQIKIKEVIAKFLTRLGHNGSIGIGQVQLRLAKEPEFIQALYENKEDLLKLLTDKEKETFKVFIKIYEDQYKGFFEALNNPEIDFCISEEEVEKEIQRREKELRNILRAWIDINEANYNTMADLLEIEAINIFAVGFVIRKNANGIRENWTEKDLKVIAARYSGERKPGERAERKMDLYQKIKKLEIFKQDKSNLKEASSPLIFGALVKIEGKINNADELKECAERLKEKGVPPLKINKILAKEVFRIFKEVIEEVRQEVSTDKLVSYVIVYCGSLARDEFVIGSDIDFMVIPLDKESKIYANTLARRIKDKLGERGFAGDYGIFTLMFKYTPSEMSWDEYIHKISGNDPSILNALLDFRVVEGDKKFIKDLKEALLKIKTKQAWIKRLIDLNEILEKDEYLYSLYSLTNGSEHIGAKSALRYIYNFLIILRLIYGIQENIPFKIIEILVEKGVISKAEAKNLKEIYDFLLEVRINKSLNPSYRVLAFVFNNYMKSMVEVIRSIQNRLLNPLKQKSSSSSPVFELDNKSEAFFNPNLKRRNASALGSVVAGLVVTGFGVSAYAAAILCSTLFVIIPAVGLMILSVYLAVMFFSQGVRIAIAQVKHGGIRGPDILINPIINVTNRQIVENKGFTTLPQSLQNSLRKDHESKHIQGKGEFSAYLNQAIGFFKLNIGGLFISLVVLVGLALLFKFSLGFSSLISTISSIMIMAIIPVLSYEIKQLVTPNRQIVIDTKSISSLTEKEVKDKLLKFGVGEEEINEILSKENLRVEDLTERDWQEILRRLVVKNWKAFRIQKKENFTDLWKKTFGIEKGKKTKLSKYIIYIIASIVYVPWYILYIDYRFFFSYIDDAREFNQHHRFENFISKDKRIMLAHIEGIIRKIIKSKHNLIYRVKISKIISRLRDYYLESSIFKGLILFTKGRLVLAIIGGIIGSAILAKLGLIIPAILSYNLLSSFLSGEIVNFINHSLQLHTTISSLINIAIIAFCLNLFKLFKQQVYRYGRIRNAEDILRFILDNKGKLTKEGIEDLFNLFKLGKVRYPIDKDIREIIERNLKELADKLKVDYPKELRSIKNYLRIFWIMKWVYILALFKTVLIDISLFPLISILHLITKDNSKVSLWLRQEIEFSWQIGRQFWRSMLALWTISAEINAAVVVGKKCGGIIEPIVIALEGPEGSINWGHRLLGILQDNILHVNLSNTLYHLIGGTGDIQDALMVPYLQHYKDQEAIEIAKEIRLKSQKIIRKILGDKSIQEVLKESGVNEGILKQYIWAYVRGLIDRDREEKKGLLYLDKGNLNTQKAVKIIKQLIYEELELASALKDNLKNKPIYNKAGIINVLEVFFN